MGVAFVLILMVVLLLTGFPMIASFAIGGLGLIIALQPSLDMSFLIQQYMSGISSFTLVSIPMFILAADIMSFGKTANHLVDLVKAFCGHIHVGCTCAHHLGAEDFVRVSVSDYFDEAALLH